MNLRARHIIPILSGGTAGSMVGWGASFLFRHGHAHAFETSLALVIGGGLAGVMVAVVVIIAKEARNPGAERPYHFIQLKGIGSTLIGRSEGRPDGSYVATEWFTFLWLPLFPLCRYRVVEDEGSRFLFHHKYTILEIVPVRKLDYSVATLIILGIVGLVAFLL